MRAHAASGAGRRERTRAGGGATADLTSGGATGVRFPVGLHFNKAGDLIGESFTPSIRFVVTNPATGRSITDADVGLDKARFLPDGSVEVLSTWIHAKARTDQNRTIFRRIGLQLIHVDAEGNETIEIVGRNFQPDEDFPRLVCGYLAGG